MKIINFSKPNNELVEKRIKDVIKNTFSDDEVLWDSMSAEPLQLWITQLVFNETDVFIVQDSGLYRFEVCVGEDEDENEIVSSAKFNEIINFIENTIKTKNMERG